MILNFETFTAFLQSTGLLGGGVVFIWALYSGKLVWGKEHTRLLREKEEWKQMTLELAGIAEKATKASEAAVHLVKDGGS